MSPTAAETPGIPRRDEIEDVLRLVHEETARYLATIDDRPVRTGRVDEALAAFGGPLPESGSGAATALRELLDKGLDATVTSAGPRCFHFVIGGTTPAALGADWLTTALDQMPYAWVASPLAVELERLSLDWLKDLFALPGEWGGIMTTGATMANFVGLASARQWWGEQHGRDIHEQGMTGLPAMPVLSGGYIHGSAIKCLGMLGTGRASVQTFSRDAVGRADLAAIEDALRNLKGAPSVLIANAGEVNAGDFDPLDGLADLAERYNCWLHVDGAFGLFARLSPRTAHLAKGADRAHSATVDGHKWLNVPYDCGFAFVHDPATMGRAFRYTGAYLPDPDDPRPVLGAIGPESSRRARALSVWATLRAYGRDGHRAMVERHLDLARHMADCVDDAPELERLAEVPLCIVCFRARPDDRDEDALNDLNRRLGEALLEDGRYYAGLTTYGGILALRPAIVNWRTRVQDVEGFVEVVRELAARIE